MKQEEAIRETGSDHASQSGHGDFGFPKVIIFPLTKTLKILMCFKGLQDYSY
jgi:hypothetical protein